MKGHGIFGKQSCWVRQTVCGDGNAQAFMSGEDPWVLRKADLRKPSAAPGSDLGGRIWKQR